MPAPQGPNPGLDTPHQMLFDDATEMQNRFTNIYNSEPAGGFFFRDGIDIILAHADCIGLRYYYAYDDNKLKIIMLGVEAETYNDLYNNTIIGRAQTDPPYNDGASITTVDQRISLPDAALLTQAFRNKYPTLLTGGFFLRSIIDYFINIDDVIGLRYKFGLTVDDKLKLIINPVHDSFYDMDVYNSASQKIECELSDGGGGGNAGNPLR